MREVIQDIKKPKRSLREVLPKSPVSTPTIKRVNQSVNDAVEPSLESAYFPPRPPSRRGAKFFGLVMMIILLAGLVAGTSVYFNRVTVKLDPTGATVTLAETTTVAAVKNPQNESELVFTLMTLETSESRLLPATGKEPVSKKASGQITIYNDYSTKSQNLIKNTRFEAENGKIYRIAEAVTVPGQKKQGSETIPGSIEATIYADQPGEEHNGALTTFTIPGFRGDPRYPKFSATSKTPLVGGLIGEVNIVDPLDQERAKAELRERLTANLFAEAKTKLPPDFVFFRESAVIDFTEDIRQSVTSGAGGEVEFTETGKFTVPIFHRQYLSQRFAQNQLPPLAKEEKVLISNLDELSFKIKEQPLASWEQREDLVFALVGEARFVWLINEEELKNSLAGLSKDGYQSVFSQYPAIKRAEVVFRPPWVRTFPSTTDKIKIETNHP